MSRDVTRFPKKEVFLKFVTQYSKKGNFHVDHLILARFIKKLVASQDLIYKTEKTTKFKIQLILISNRIVTEIPTLTEFKIQLILISNRMVTEILTLTEFKIQLI